MIYFSFSLERKKKKRKLQSIVGGPIFLHVCYAMTNEHTMGTLWAMRSCIIEEEPKPRNGHFIIITETQAYLLKCLN